MPAPAARALSSVDITRLGQLTAFKETEIACLHGVGPKAIAALRDALASRGWSFAD